MRCVVSQSGMKRHVELNEGFCQCGRREGPESWGEITQAESMGTGRQQGSQGVI